MRALAVLTLALAGCGSAATGEDAGLIPPLADLAAAPPVDGAVTLRPDLATSGPTTAIVYVSGYSPQIAVMTLDLVSGQLTPKTTLPITGSPSFLAIDLPRHHLFAVNEQANGQVESFVIDPQSGALTHLNDVASGGNGPAHVSVDATGKWLFAANYGDGVIAVLPIQPDGSLTGTSSTLSAGANAHQMIADASNKFVFVPCKGADYVAQYTFNATTGSLGANPHFNTAAGSGPRHLAFHPNGTFAYLIAENASTMSAYSIVAGQLVPLPQTLSTRAAGAAGTNTGAEVQVHPSGKFLYGSNRGDDSIVLYTLDAAGHMTFQTTFPTGGKTPRDFTIDPTGRWLIVANQDSNDLFVLSIDANSGALTMLPTAIAAPSPTYVGVVVL
jgi:6-phosphogluconolactonase